MAEVGAFNRKCGRDKTRENTYSKITEKIKYYFLT